MVLHRQRKELLRFVELPCVAMNFSQLISGVGVAGIDFQFLRELFRCGGHVFRRVALPRTRQQRPPYPVMNARPPGINGEHLTILADGCVVRSLAFVGFGFSLMPPHRCGSHLRELLHAQEGKVSEDSPGVVEDLGITRDKDDSTPAPRRPHCCRAAGHYRRAGVADRTCA